MIGAVVPGGKKSNWIRDTDFSTISEQGMYRWFNLPDCGALEKKQSIREE